MPYGGRASFLEKKSKTMQTLKTLVTEVSMKMISCMSYKQQLIMIFGMTKKLVVVVGGEFRLHGRYRK